MRSQMYLFGVGSEKFSKAVVPAACPCPARRPDLRPLALLLELTVVVCSLIVPFSISAKNDGKVSFTVSVVRPDLLPLTDRPDDCLVFLPLEDFLAFDCSFLPLERSLLADDSRERLLLELRADLSVDRSDRPLL